MRREERLLRMGQQRQGTFWTKRLQTDGVTLRLCAPGPMVAPSRTRKGEIAGYSAERQESRLGRRLHFEFCLR